MSRKNSNILRFSASLNPYQLSLRSLHIRNYQCTDAPDCNFSTATKNAYTRHRKERHGYIPPPVPKRALKQGHAYHPYTGPSDSSSRQPSQAQSSAPVFNKDTVPARGPILTKENSFEGISPTAVSAPNWCSASPPDPDALQEFHANWMTFAEYSGDDNFGALCIEAATGGDASYVQIPKQIYSSWYESEGLCPEWRQMSNLVNGLDPCVVDV